MKCSFWLSRGLVLGLSCVALACTSGTGGGGGSGGGGGGTGGGGGGDGGTGGSADPCADIAGTYDLGGASCDGEGIDLSEMLVRVTITESCTFETLLGDNGGCLQGMVGNVDRHGGAVDFNYLDRRCAAACGVSACTDESLAVSWLAILTKTINGLTMEGAATGDMFDDRVTFCAPGEEMVGTYQTEDDTCAEIAGLFELDTLTCDGVDAMDNDGSYLFTPDCLMRFSMVNGTCTSIFDGTVELNGTSLTLNLDSMTCGSGCPPMSCTDNPTMDASATWTYSVGATGIDLSTITTQAMIDDHTSSCAVDETVAATLTTVPAVTPPAGTEGGAPPACAAIVGDYYPASAACGGQALDLSNMVVQASIDDTCGFRSDVLGGDGCMMQLTGTINLQSDSVALWQYDAKECSAACDVTCDDPDLDLDLLGTMAIDGTHLVFDLVTSTAMREAQVSPCTGGEIFEESLAPTGTDCADYAGLYELTSATCDGVPQGVGVMAIDGLLTSDCQFVQVADDDPCINIMVGTITISGATAEISFPETRCGGDCSGGGCTVATGLTRTLSTGFAYDSGTMTVTYTVDQQTLDDHLTGCALGEVAESVLEAW